MKRRIHRSDEEWMQLITSCRQSGLSDKEWCVSNGIVVSSFYNAVVRLRKKACQIPEREQNAERIYDLTASSFPDVVRLKKLFRLPLVPQHSIFQFNKFSVKDFLQHLPAWYPLQSSDLTPSTTDKTCNSTNDLISPRLFFLPTSISSRSSSFK